MNALSIESAHVFSVFLGGIIGQAFRIQYPAMVKTLTVGCSVPGGWGSAQKKVPPPSAAIAYSTDTTIHIEERVIAQAEVAYSPGYSKRHPEVVERLISARENNPIDFNSFKRGQDTTDHYDGFSELVNIACPCLIVTGKLDQLIDYRNSIILSEQIIDADLLILGCSGHIFWEEKKDLFLSTFFSFTEREII